MKRREFLKVAVVGSAGALIGARLAKATEQLPVVAAAQDDVATEACSNRLDEFADPGELYQVVLVEDDENKRKIVAHRFFENRSDQLVMVFKRPHFPLLDVGDRIVAGSFATQRRL